jgi:L-alanine-DL-glutamate epimerase-like enolase superfamily enzyme
VHLHLALAHPACVVLEYIPWTLDCFLEPAKVSCGRFTPPELPGAGTHLQPEALCRFGVPLR